MYTRTQIRTDTHRHTHIHTDTHTQTHTHTDTHTQTYTHTHTQTRTHRHTQTHTDIHTYRHTHRHTHIQTHTHTHTHIQTHTYRHTHTDTYTHTYTQTHTHIHTYTHIYTFTHTHIQTYRQTYMCIYIYIWLITFDYIWLHLITFDYIWLHLYVRKALYHPFGRKVPKPSRSRRQLASKFDGRAVAASDDAGFTERNPEAVQYAKWWKNRFRTNRRIGAPEQGLIYDICILCSSNHQTFISCLVIGHFWWWHRLWFRRSRRNWRLGKCCLWPQSSWSTLVRERHTETHRDTLWLFNNITMEKGPFIDGLPITNGDFPWLC